MNNESQSRQKVGLITGSTSGLGRNIADHLADQGFLVGINGRNFEKTEQVASQHRNFFPFSFDVTDNSSCLSAAQKLRELFQHIDFLICNVGGGSIKSDLSQQQKIESMIKLNLVSTYNVLESLLDILKDFSSRVLIISSIATTGKTDAPLEYLVAKSALNSYGIGKARDLGKRGISVNLISPGNLDFTGSIWDRRMKKNPDATLQYIRDRVPFGKLISPDEISELICFILQGKMPNATGNNYIVDGGQCL